MAVIDGRYVSEARPVPIGIFETGLIELVGINEQVDQNDYGAHVTADLKGSGEILSACFMSTEDGTGDVQEPAGKQLIFNGSVSIASAKQQDVALSAHQRVFGPSWRVCGRCR